MFDLEKAAPDRLIPDKFKIDVQPVVHTVKIELPPIQADLVREVMGDLLWMVGFLVFGWIFTAILKVGGKRG